MFRHSKREALILVFRRSKREALILVFRHSKREVLILGAEVKASAFALEDIA